MLMLDQCLSSLSLKLLLCTHFVKKIACDETGKYWKLCRLHEHVFCSITMDKCAEEVTMLQIAAFTVQFAKGPDLPTDDYLWFRMAEELSTVKGECVSPRYCREHWKKACQRYEVFTRVFNNALPKMAQADSCGLVRRNCSASACVPGIPRLKAVENPTATGVTKAVGFVSWNDRHMVDLIDAVLLAVGPSECPMDAEENIPDNGLLWVKVAELLHSKLLLNVPPKSARRHWILLEECYLSLTQRPAATSKFIELMKEAEDCGAMAFKTIPLRKRPKKKVSRQTEDCDISESSINTATVPTSPPKNFDFTTACGNGNHTVDTDSRTSSTAVASSSKGVLTTTTAASSEAAAVELTLSSKIDKLTDALTELIAVQRQQLEESRRHGQNMERLLARLIGVELDKIL